MRARESPRSTLLLRDPMIDRQGKLVGSRLTMPKSDTMNFIAYHEKWPAAEKQRSAQGHSNHNTSTHHFQPLRCPKPPMNAQLFPCLCHRTKREGDVSGGDQPT